MLERHHWCTYRCSAALSILLLGIISGLQAAPLQYAPSAADPDIQVHSTLKGVRRATSADDIYPLVRDNLLPDLAPWKARAQPLRALDTLHLLHQIHTSWPEYRRHFVAVVLIRNNRITWWAYPKARTWCTGRVEYTKQEFLNYTRSHGLTLPDVMFVMNGYDKPLCAAGNCSAPVFSFDKSWNGTHSPHDDILFPVMNHPFEGVVHYPWDKKQDVGFMRAGIYAAMSADCQRVRLHHLGQSPAAAGVLDVGIYKNRHWKVKVRTVPPVTMEQHATYKFLLNSDGQAASWRLAKLLAIDSVVLKYRSPAIEYYYRSLHSGTHYLDMDETDLLDVMQRLKAPGEQAHLQAIAAQAQAFAYRYLGQLQRTLYAMAALSHYRNMVPDMDDLLAQVPDDFTMDSLLRLRDEWMLRDAEGSDG